MEFKLYTLLIPYTIFCNYNYFSNGKPIIGNNIKQATQNEFTYIVSIMVITNKELDITKDLMCGGTLISPEDVLTSEHCFNDLQHGNNFVVLIGSIDLLNATKFYPSWWMAYDNWAVHGNVEIKCNQNDIAIIRIIGYTPYYVLPGILNPMPSTHFYGGNATIAGWGLSNNNTVSQILQTATTIILTKNDCETRISNIMEETASLEDIYMCSIADPYVLLNYGDSGGPLIYNGNIIAINKGTCPLRKNTVNTLEVNVHLNIEFYTNFIFDLIYNN